MLSAPEASDVEVPHPERVVFDEVASSFNFVALPGGEGSSTARQSTTKPANGQDCRTKSGGQNHEAPLPSLSKFAASPYHARTRIKPNQRNQANAVAALPSGKNPLKES